MPKIHSLHLLADILAELRQAGERIVLCHGVWDLLHPGHSLHFRAARKLGDVLVVTVTPDEHVHKGPGRPLFPDHWRAIAVASQASTDYVAINQWPTAVETIKLLQPHVFVKGQEFRGALTWMLEQEQAAVESVGGKLCFTDEEEFHSTDLIQRLREGN